MTTRDQWLPRLAKLNIDRSRGPAPHKPLLLLAVLARLDEGEELPAVLPLSPELAFRFQTLWAVVAHRRPQRPEVRMPFHHLESDGVWAPLMADGTPSPHRGQTRLAAVAPAFAAFAADPVNRRDAKRVLVRGYFTPAEQSPSRNSSGSRPRTSSPATRASIRCWSSRWCSGGGRRGSGCGWSRRTSTPAP